MPASFTPMFPGFDQRWADRVEYRRVPGDRIDPREFGVDIVGKRDAKAFCVKEHYSGSYPAAHCAVGLFRKTGCEPSRLVGLAVFSEGIQSGRGLPRWTGFPAAEGTELGRLVLLPEVAFNGETWFIRRAFDALRREKPHVRAVLSYSDPTERATETGLIVKRGHVGTIYQASNACYLGRSEPRTLGLLPDGRVVQFYNFYKFKKRKDGWAAAERTIQHAAIASGCAPRADDESDADWADRVKAALRPLAHPGNLTYAFGMDTTAWQQIRALNNGGLPYCKARDLAPSRPAHLFIQH